MENNFIPAYYWRSYSGSLSPEDMQIEVLRLKRRYGLLEPTWRDRIADWLEELASRVRYG